MEKRSTANRRLPVIISASRIGVPGVAFAVALLVSPLELDAAQVAAPAPAQPAPAAAAAPFEVVSVKPARSETAGGGRATIAMQPGGRFTATQITVRDLIKLAYGAPVLDDARVTGGPAWVGSDRFDIEARAAAGAPPQQPQPMLRALLADRFALVLRSEMRESPVYALVLASPDGRLGPRLRRSEDCTISGTRKGPGATSDPAAMCGGGGSAGRLAFGGIPLAIGLLPALSRDVQRIVVDRTGLTGFFDGSLEWTPNPLAATLPDAPPSSADGPSIFAAVQEQLGLKLVPATAPIDVFVIVSAERPAPN
jgi:uncharacterized protein (TIGR03435 family)